MSDPKVKTSRSRRDCWHFMKWKKSMNQFLIPTTRSKITKQPRSLVLVEQTVQEKESFEFILVVTVATSFCYLQAI